MTAAEAFRWARGGSVVCSCGRPLLPRFNAEGERVGVTHTAEDDEHHFTLWTRIQAKRSDPEEECNEKS